MISSSERVLKMDKATFYRQSRLWHAYLSAFAFLALIFFTLTGILLNHPDWFAGQPAATEKEIELPLADIAEAQASAIPGETLAALVARHAALKGSFKSAEIADGAALIRLEGAFGASDIEIDLTSGHADVAVQPHSFVTLMGDLHKGKDTGGVWRALIDITGVLILALSLIGYVLFFTLRYRLATSLKLTAASLLVMGGVIFLFVP